MVGQGLKASRYDPVADMISLEETRSRLDHIRTAVANSADYMPTHKQFIMENCAS
jgi:tryptophan halogenase